jgi:hypothetical protein
MSPLDILQIWTRRSWIQEFSQTKLLQLDYSAYVDYFWWNEEEISNEEDKKEQKKG